MPDCFDLRIAVIGAGMGGLGCALSLAKKGFKHIDVYESAADLGFVGAGIQMAPNMIRILDRLDCWEGIYKEATDVHETSIRQGSTDEELTHVDMSKIGEQYGFPHCAGHRAALAGGLYAACQIEPAIQFHFGIALVGVDTFSPRPVVRLQQRKPFVDAGGSTTSVAVDKDKDKDSTTTTQEFDVVLGADGIKSNTRTALLDHLGLAAEEFDTGQAAYRIMLTREQMQTANDPAMLQLLDSDTVVRWIGPQRHIIAYAVDSHQIYNLASAQPDVHFAAAPSATYTTRGSKSVMLDVFADFCPLVQKMLQLVPEGEVCEWRLRQHRELPTWSLGNVTLLGDACHPTLPHLSQGAAMAIEDGAVLAEVLSRVTDFSAGSSATISSPSPSSVTVADALKTYERLRKSRTSLLVDMAYHSGRALHLGEGAAKEERDRQFAAHRANGNASIPDKWASPDVQKMIYSHDCVADTAERFDQLYAAVVAEGAKNVTATNGASK